MSCTLIDRSPRILAGLPDRLATVVMRELGRQQIEVVTGAQLAQIDAERLLLQDGRAVASDFTVWTTGAAAAGWLRESGLATGRTRLHIDRSRRCSPRRTPRCSPPATLRR
jgi:NADH dehydrogenase FAD-containing subunit